MDGEQAKPADVVVTKSTGAGLGGLGRGGLGLGDLGLRVISGVAMAAVAGLALWAGGYVWALLVALLAGGVLWEWSKLSSAIASGMMARTSWFFGGVVYVGIAAEMLLMLRMQAAQMVLLVVLPVLATDIGAYFAGRFIGGAKIAPAISPSKTWAGLAGGMIASALTCAAFLHFVLCWQAAAGPFNTCHSPAYHAMLVAVGCAGALVALVAQAGDFFESWMKRRAGVKDSGSLLPGHGGLFDRLDGLLAVCFVLGIVVAGSRLAGHG